VKKTDPNAAQGGVTLLELMLVLSISGLVFVMGIKMYQAFQNTLQLQELSYNVDELFEAAGNYYRANCAAGGFSPNPPSFLSQFPVNTAQTSYPPTASYPVSIVANLLATGYLNSQNWPPANPVVDPSGGESGYLVQLNPIVSTVSIPVNACVVLTPGTACLPITSGNLTSPNNAYAAVPGTTIPSTQAQVVSWVVQVAVKVQPQSKIAAYAAATGADCLSDSASPGTVDPCSLGNGSHRYLVWSRLPSAALKKTTVFSYSMQLLKQYNLMYSHDQYYEMNAGYSATTNPAQAPVYYLCGG